MDSTPTKVSLTVLQKSSVSYKLRFALQKSNNVSYKKIYGVFYPERSQTFKTIFYAIFSSKSVFDG